MSSPARDDIQTLRDFLDTHEFVGDTDIEQVRAALSRLEALRDAARDRLPYGHNDTCDFELGEGAYECSCGHDALRDALAACDNETSRT